MLISPRMLFGKSFESKWHFVGLINGPIPIGFHTQMNAICPECSKVHVWNTPITVNLVTNKAVVLSIQKLTDGKTTANFWIGNCQCGMVLWACENFNWIRLLTEEQLIKTIVNELGVGHEVSGDRLTIVPINFDHKGKVIGSCLEPEYIRQHLLKINHALRI